MSKGNGNGGRGGDLLVNLHAEVVDLRTSLASNHRETEAAMGAMKAAMAAMARQFQETTAMTARHHQQTDQHLGRIAQMLSRGRSAE